MSANEDAIALVQRYYAAFNDGDVEGMIDCLADDVRHDVNEGDARGGKEAFRSFCAHMTRCYRERLDDVIVMASADGGRVAAEFIVDGVYLETDAGLPAAAGQRYRLPAGGFFTIENGRIARVTTYYNLREWIRQIDASQ